MEPPAAATTSAQNRRQNPSRSKRGGPGVGTCDVDLMILESYKRKLETEPLIPEDTAFVLSTNSSKFSGQSTTNGDPTINVNIVANDRYFDRPEVLRAFREQEIIQTPEFWAISESSSVGGRFRPRGAEDESAETSDAAYEKRHKKFETFEKRQRLREKEKLKHEHYKLKERIEQLRATDSSAFMAVPAATFWALPPQDKTEAVVEQQTDAFGNPMVTVEQLEGERRKKEMLDHAISLEKRYSYLLPSERARKTNDLTMADKVFEEEEEETERIPQAGPSRKETESIKLRLPARSSLSTTPVSSPAATKPPKKYKASHKQPFASRAAHNSVSASLPPPDQGPSVSSPIIDIEMQTPEPERLQSPSRSPFPTAALPLSEMPEVPVSHARATPIKLSTSTRQTNGKGRAQKEVIFKAVDPGEAVKPAKRKYTRRAPLPVQIADDGESEKAPSDEELAQKEEPQTFESDLNELSNAQHRQNYASDAEMLDPEVSPEAREAATRLEQAGSPPVSPSNDYDQPPLRYTHEDSPPTQSAPMKSPEPEPELEPVPLPEPELEESISVRPQKRQKKLTIKGRGRPSAKSATPSQAQNTPSLPPQSPPAFTSAPSRQPRKHPVPRGQQSQVYISSTTGEEIRTTSFLLMAAIRSEGAKRNVEKRHNTSFGIATPAFKPSDFEIPEWMHYPEDEEPAVPLPDIDYPQIQYQSEPDPHPARDEEHDAQTAVKDAAIAMQSLDVKPRSKSSVVTTPEPSEPESEDPIQQLSPQQDVPHVPDEELQDEHMETEPAEPEEVEESPPPTEIESEPGVGIRVLSASRDDEEEELEW